MADSDFGFITGSQTSIDNVSFPPSHLQKCVFCVWCRMCVTRKFIVLETFDDLEK